MYLFQNYEFKLVDGKCCPECVEGASLFQVVTVTYLLSSLYRFFHKLRRLFYNRSIVFVFLCIYLQDCLFARHIFYHD